MPEYQNFFDLFLLFLRNYRCENNQLLIQITINISSEIIIIFYFTGKKNIFSIVRKRYKIVKVELY